MALPAINQLPVLPTEQRAAILDTLFEPSTSLHTLCIDLLHTKTFRSYDDLIISVGNLLTDLAESTFSSDTKWLDDILGAHPRLGAKKVESLQSQAEQVQLQSGAVEEAKSLQKLNDSYEAAFPSLRFV